MVLVTQKIIVHEVSKGNMIHIKAIQLCKIMHKEWLLLWAKIIP